MKKILGLLIACTLLVLIPLTTAASELQENILNLNTIVVEEQEQTADENWTGEFEAEFGIERPDLPNWTALGSITGYYKSGLGRRGRLSFFAGEWISYEENHSGTVRGIFGRFLLLGRITIDQPGRDISLPILGFIKAEDEEVIGRIMAPVGPALYFTGTYWLI